MDICEINGGFSPIGYQWIQRMFIQEVIFQKKRVEYQTETVTIEVKENITEGGGGLVGIQRKL